MYSIRIESFFEAAHNLRSYHGKPEPLHGHSWKVELEVLAPKLDTEEMGIDFVDLRKSLNEMVRKIDYTYINEVSPFNDIAPSAENIAKWFYEGLRNFVESRNCKLKEVRVWEGRHASAAYVAN